MEGNDGQRYLIVYTPYWILEVSIELIGYDFIVKNSWWDSEDVGFNSVRTDSLAELAEAQRDRIKYSHIKKDKKKYFWPYLTPEQVLSRDNWNKNQCGAGGNQNQSSQSQ